MASQLGGFVPKDSGRYSIDRYCDFSAPGEVSISPEVWWLWCLPHNQRDTSCESVVYCAVKLFWWRGDTVRRSSSLGQRALGAGLMTKRLGMEIKIKDNHIGTVFDAILREFWMTTEEVDEYICLLQLAQGQLRQESKRD